MSPDRSRPTWRREGLRKECAHRDASRRPTQPSGRPATRFLDDAAEIREGRCRRGVKQHAPLLVAREDAVEYEHMEVDVQVQTAESMNCQHRSATCLVKPDALGPGVPTRARRGGSSQGHRVT
jgi:hypothetical protein